MFDWNISYVQDILKDGFIYINSLMPVAWVDFIAFSEHS